MFVSVQAAVKGGIHSISAFFQLPTSGAGQQVSHIAASPSSLLLLIQILLGPCVLPALHMYQVTCFCACLLSCVACRAVLSPSCCALAMQASGGIQSSPGLLRRD